MKKLQEIFDSFLSKEQIGAFYIKRKLREQGIEVTDDMLENIKSRVGSEDNVFDLEISNIDAQILIDFDERDFENFVQKYSDDVVGIIPKFVEGATPTILKILKQNAPSMLVEREEITVGFNERLYRRWGTGIDLLRMLLVIALEAGEEFNKEFRPQASSENDCVFEVLTRLHAKACLVAHEIIVLLRSGLSDGAYSRWRTLYEISVVGYFIVENGHNMAERFLDYRFVETYQAALQLREHNNILGIKNLSDRNLKKLEKDFNDLLKKYGSDFKKPYGWALTFLGRKQVTFRDIEAIVGFDHIRPYYRMASYGVHANPKGLHFNLGSNIHENLLLAGPSIFGLADPGHATAIGLLQITTSLLMLKPNIDRMVTCRIMQEVSDEIGQAFIKAHRRLETKRRKKNNGKLKYNKKSQRLSVI